MSAAAVDPQPSSPTKAHKDKHGRVMGWVKDHLPHKSSSSPRHSKHSGSQPSSPTATSPTPPTPTSTSTLPPTPTPTSNTTTFPTPTTTTTVMHASSPPIVLGLGPERPASGAAVYPVVTPTYNTPTYNTPTYSSSSMPTALSSVKDVSSGLMSMSSVASTFGPTTPTFGTAPATPLSSAASNQQQQQVRYVRLCIHEARNLTAKDANGFSDPYVTISLGSQRAKSPIIHKSLNPVWEHSVLLTVSDLIAEEIELNVWDYDRGVANDFLGRVTMPLAGMMVEQSKGENEKRWYKLGKRSETSTVSGEICVSHTFLYGGGENVEVPNLENTPIAEAADLGDRPSDLDGWTLQVHIMEARNLPAMDSDGFSDPYVDIRIGKQSFKTEIVPKNLNPKWDQTFNIEIEGNPEFVKFKVWDFDRKSRDDFIGMAKVPISKVRVVQHDADDNNNNNKEEEDGNNNVDNNDNNNKEEEGAKSKKRKEDQPAHSLRSPSDVTGDLLGTNDPENLDIDARWLILEARTMHNKNVLKKALTSVRHLNSKSGGLDKDQIRPLGELLVSLKLMPPAKVSPVEEEDEEASEQAAEGGAGAEAEANEPPPEPISVPDPLEVALCDEELPVSSKVLHRLIFGSDSKVMEAYNERQQRREVVTKPWVRDESGKMVRKNQFVMPVNAPMAPKEAQVFETYTVLVHEKGGTVVDLRVDTPHMPYGSSFYIHMQYVIQYKTPKTCRLRMSMEVFFVKSPMVKSMIKKGSTDGVLTANKNFMEIVRQMAAKESKSAGGHAAGTDAGASPADTTDNKSTSSFQPQSNNHNYATTTQRGVTYDTYLLAAIVVLLLFLAIQSMRAVGLLREFQCR